MPWFSSKLPNYSGEYGVGTVDVEAPIDPPRRTGDAVLTENEKPAFQADTVLFSLFYPTTQGEKGNGDKHYWVPKPLALHAEGYARFAKINSWLTKKVFTFGLWALVGNNRIPAEVDASLLHEKEGSGPGQRMHPVIVFSHGMASGRTSYTQYCGELASRGYVVAAIEHRDGSGPGSVVVHPDGTSDTVFHIGTHDVHPHLETSEFKAKQLGMRQVEVEETVRVLRAINSGKGQAVFEGNSRAEGSTLADWEGRLDMERVVIGGHSYGATLALQALKGAPSPALPFQGGIILDPGKQSGPLNDDVNVPIVIVHSQSWSAKHTIFQGRPHFEVVRDLALGLLDRKIPAWFLTSKGTTHPSVTDAPLIEPMLLSWTTGATIDVRDGVEQYVNVTDDFILFIKDGHPQGILKEGVSHPAYNDESRPIGNANLAKMWQVHVAP